MNKKLVPFLFYLNIIQLLVYLFGFFNRVAVQTGKIPLVDVTTLWQNFSGILYWSLVSMLCVIGLTISLYLLLSKEFSKEKLAGLIISAVGYGSPILFSFFLIIPATLLILGSIFIKLMNLSNEDEKENSSSED